MMKISGISAGESDGVCRVSADVNGRELWFESADTRLEPTAEAFAGAMVVPALKFGSDISIDETLDAAWLNNVRQILKMYREWWGYPLISIRSRGASAYRKEPEAGTALFFSMGGDSFFSLFTSREAIDRLVFVHGFDTFLTDGGIRDVIRPALQDIGRKFGKKVIIVRTNLRKHPLYRRVSWDRAHGAALAAIGHLLSGVGRVVIAATYQREQAKPYGSHWQVDPLWSTEAVQIVHDGAEAGKSDKLRAIADEPMAQKYLRVCFYTEGGPGNCGRCLKCIRTMLTFAQLGKLERFPFPKDRSFAELLDGIRETPPVLERVYSQFLDAGFDEETEAAVRRVIERARKTGDSSKALGVLKYWARRGLLPVKRFFWR